MIAGADLARRVDRLETLVLDLQPVRACGGWMPSLSAIVADAAQLTGESEASLIGVRRTRAIVLARNAVIWTARRAGGFSHPQIGRVLGNRDHSTIIWGYRNAERLYEQNADFRSLCAILCDRAMERAQMSAEQRDPALVMHQRCIALVEAAPCSSSPERQLKREIVAAMRAMLTQPLEVRQ